MTYIEEIRLAAAPEKVWSLLVLEGGAAELLPGLRRAEAGRGTVRATLAGHAVTYRGYGRQHIEEPGKRVTWTLSGREVRGEGRAHIETRARVREAPGGGCDLRLTILVDGRGRIDEAGAEAQQRAVSQGVARFRRALETRLRQEPVRVAEPAAAGPPPQLEILPPVQSGVTLRERRLAGALGLAALAASVWVAWRYLRRR
ncbi:MAG: SRPBCC family protein [Candidatus Dormibacteraeota bacterium]|nr:SRPBCC family protein [Candidatus Dormibacteraeota bacterium]